MLKGSVCQLFFYWKSRNPIAFAFWLFFTSFHKSHLIYCVSNYSYSEFFLANITKPIYKQNREFETLLCQLWIIFEKLWITIKLLWKRRKVWESIPWCLVHCTVLRLESLDRAPSQSIMKTTSVTTWFKEEKNFAPKWINL